MLNFFPWDSTKALARAISSAFCTEVPSTRAWASITLSVVTTTYPAWRWPLATVHEAVPVCIQLLVWSRQWLVQQILSARINLVNNF